MIMWGKQDPTEIAKVIKSSLEAIANEITWEDVPGTTIESCGNYKDHSLHSAKEWAKLVPSVVMPSFFSILIAARPSEVTGIFTTMPRNSVAQVFRFFHHTLRVAAHGLSKQNEIGRASCRERVSSPV